MVGFLCSERREKRFANHLHHTMMPFLKNQQKHIVVFAMSDVNLMDKTVFGHVISEESVAKLKVKLPPVILNFSVQSAKPDFKKLMDLIEAEGFTLINASNTFNQWTIMKMLSSDSKTKRYIMPFVNISKEEITFDFSKVKNFIVRPLNGAKLSKTIYCKKTYTGFDLYNWGGTIYSHLFNIENAIIPTIRSGKWVLSVSPELITYDNNLLVIRSYLQRNKKGEWTVVLKTEMPKTDCENRILDKKVDDSLLKIISYINCFIPDLHFCTIDLVVSKDGLPYFLNLGGWQDLTTEKQHKILFKALCQNLMAYSDTILNN